jgi:hypothetical protein
MEYPECFGDMGHKVYCLGYEAPTGSLDEDERSEAIRREAIACHRCRVFDPCWKISLNAGLHGSELHVADRLSAIESALGGGGPQPRGFHRMH